MNREERLALFRAGLTKLVESKGKGYVIFDSLVKFVQFATELDGFLVDIPLEGMSKDEEMRLQTLKEFSSSDVLRDPKSNQLVSYQSKFSKEELEKAVLLTEQIFIEIFELSPDYGVEAKIDLACDEIMRATKEFDLNSLGGHEFEDLIEKLIKKMGFMVEERKMTADGGIDMLAHSQEPLFAGKYVIQCKRHDQKIPEHPVRDLYGVVHSKNANKGILITNSTFTQAATDFARDKQLELIDGEKLGSLLSKYGIILHGGGVKFSGTANFLLYSFLPSMKKARENYENIKNKKVYVERSPAGEKEWRSLFHKTFENTTSFFEWWGKNGVPNFVHLLTEKPPNMQKIKEMSDQLIQAIRKQVETYKVIQGTSPPTRFSTAHKKYLEFLEAIFEDVFPIVQKLELIAELSTENLKEKADKEGRLNIQYNMTFPREAAHAVIVAYKEALSDAR
jgi:HJR/Mrr/RecB family endonuclease